MVTIVLACLCVVLIAVTVILVLLRQSTNATTGSATASTSAVSTSVASRMQTATRAADGAATTARSKFDTMTGIPTVPKVAAVINPYVASLDHYATVLSRTRAPAAARPAARNADALVVSDVKFLGTINGLPSLRLGSYLVQFGRDATQLRNTLGTLEGKLSPGHRARSGMSGASASPLVHSPVLGHHDG